VLLVEQNAYQALKVADRGYVVETGRLAVAGDARDLLDDDQMRSAYLGKNATRTSGMSSVEASVTGTLPAQPGEPDGRP
jgi:branched-chain amino acid transport system ATP-binding protein